MSALRGVAVPGLPPKRDVRADTTQPHYQKRTGPKFTTPAILPGASTYLAEIGHDGASFLGNGHEALLRRPSLRGCAGVMASPLKKDIGIVSIRSRQIDVDRNYGIDILSRITEILSPNNIIEY
jgi:hypothetical protein